MEPDGDPEARIRDLERPLADRAYTNELRTQPYEATPSADVPVAPYPYNAPPPPGAYPQWGSPYYSPPQTVVHKRSPALWLLPVIVGIVVIGAAGAIFFFNFSSFNTGSPGIAGGGGSVDTPDVDIPTPAAPPVVKPFDPSDDVVTVEAGDTLSLGGIEQHKTIVCNQGTVNISGMTNTVEVKGDCVSVSVSGMNNVITVESARSITASGFDNHVTYRSGVPEVSQSGSGNIIEQG